MKLTARLVLFVVLGISLLLVADGALTVHRELGLLRADMRDDSLVIGESLRGLVLDAWRRRGQDYALAQVAAIDHGGSPVDIRWVWPDAEAADAGHAPLADRHHLAPLTRGDSAWAVVARPGQPDLLCTYVPVAVPGGRLGALELSESLGVLTAREHSLYLRTAALVAVSIGVGAVAVVLLGLTMVGRPLRRLIDKVRRVGTGDLTEPLQLRGNYELTELAAAINVMCDRLEEAQDRIRGGASARVEVPEQPRHSYRLTPMGRLSAGIAHELGTPLNVISGHAGLIGSGQLLPEGIVHSAGVIKSQGERMAQIVRQLLDFARRGDTPREPTDLRALAQRSVELLTPMARRADIELEMVAGEPVEAPLNAAQIQQVLMNLIVNSIQASPAQGRIRVGVRHGHGRAPARAESQAGPCACVYVEDDGEGIAPENLEHLFDPFFTTREVGEGTGLGLAIAYGIVQEHGGWINVLSTPGEGSLFTVFLPLDAAAWAHVS